MSDELPFPEAPPKRAPMRFSPEALRERMNKVRMPVQRLAKRSGVSKATIYAVLAGTTQPKVDTALALAFVLKCRVEDFGAVLENVLPETAK